MGNLALSLSLCVLRIAPPSTKNCSFLESDKQNGQVMRGSWQEPKWRYCWHVRSIWLNLVSKMISWKKNFSYQYVQFINTPYSCTPMNPSRNKERPGSQTPNPMLYEVGNALKNRLFILKYACIYSKGNGFFSTVLHRLLLLWWATLPSSPALRRTRRGL